MLYTWRQSLRHVGCEGVQLDTGGSIKALHHQAVGADSSFHPLFLQTDLMLIGTRVRPVDHRMRDDAEL